jgi:hypothetical protein
MGIPLDPRSIKTGRCTEKKMHAWAQEDSREAFLEMFDEWGELTGVRAASNGRYATVTIGTAIEGSNQLMVRGRNRNWSVLIVRDGRKLVIVSKGSQLRSLARKRSKSRWSEKL